MPLACDRERQSHLAHKIEVGFRARSRQTRKREGPLRQHLGHCDAARELTPWLRPCPAGRGAHGHLVPPPQVKPMPLGAPEPSAGYFGNKWTADAGTLSKWISTPRWAAAWAIRPPMASGSSA